MFIESCYPIKLDRQRLDLIYDLLTISEWQGSSFGFVDRANFIIWNYRP